VLINPANCWPSCHCDVGLRATMVIGLRAVVVIGLRAIVFFRFWNLPV
jgi:hypothetical protein